MVASRHGSHMLSHQGRWRDQTLSLLKTPSGGFPMAPLQLATPMSRDWGGGAVREALNPVRETDEKMTGRAAA